MGRRFLDLFSGSGSVSQAARSQGYEVRSLDLDPNARGDVTYPVDILTFDYEKELCTWIPDVIWASPPCTEYSVAKTRAPRRIREANKVVRRTLEIISWVLSKNPKALWVLENPQTGYLKQQPFMHNLPFTDADYCCYGLPYRKRTRFWTNNPRVLKTPLKLCPGAGRCKHMVDGRHIQSVGNCDPRYGSMSLFDKYRVPKSLMLKLITASP